MKHLSLLFRVLPKASCTSRAILWIEFMRFLVDESWKYSQQRTLSDLGAAARKNRTIKALDVEVDAELARRCFLLVNVLLRKLPLVESFWVTFVDSEIDFRIQNKFLERCLRGVTHLTSITLDVPEDDAFEGMVDWSIFSRLKNLRSLIVRFGPAYEPWVMVTRMVPLNTLVRALSDLVYLETAIIDGFCMGIESPVSSDVQQISGFLRGRSLGRLELYCVHLHSPTVLQAFVLGLACSRIKHLCLSYWCHSEDDSSAVMAAITKCKAFETLRITAHKFWPRFPIAPRLHDGADIVLLNSRLNDLHLSNFTISDGEAKKMSLALTQSNCALENLEVRHCNVSHLGIGILLSSLTTTTSIRHVWISRRTGLEYEENFDRRMLVHIEQALAFLVDTPLLTLHLFDFCELFNNQEIAHSMAQCLARNYHLESISISYVDEESQALLDSIGRLNAAGRRYLRSSTSRKVGVEILGKVSCDLDAIFICLCENPSLCAS